MAEKLFYFKRAANGGIVSTSYLPSYRGRDGYSELPRAEGARLYRAQTIEHLRDALPEGTAIYTLVRGTPARSGMSRRISLFYVEDGKIRALDPRAAVALERAEHKDGGLQVNGGGMDMGFSLVYDLACTLHNNPTAFTQNWL